MVPNRNSVMTIWFLKESVNTSIDDRKICLKKFTINFFVWTFYGHQPFFLKNPKKRYIFAACKYDFIYLQLLSNKIIPLIYQLIQEAL